MAVVDFRVASSSTVIHHPFFYSEEAYLFLCLFLRSLFLRLCVAILWPFFFLPFGIVVNVLNVVDYENIFLYFFICSAKLLAGL